jgi:hypothetical protein
VDIAIGLEEGDSAKAILAWMSNDNQNVWKNVQKALYDLKVEDQSVCQKSNQDISNIHEYSWITWLEYDYRNAQKIWLD